MEDEYGYKKRFKDYDADQLIEAFNRDVGNPGWVRARGFFLVALRKALLATGLDCSGFIDEEGMSMQYKIKQDGKRIVPIGCSLNAKPKNSLILVNPAVKRLDRSRSEAR
jgi:hypothetical protein